MVPLARSSLVSCTVDSRVRAASTLSHSRPLTRLNSPESHLCYFLQHSGMYCIGDSVLTQEYFRVGNNHAIMLSSCRLAVWDEAVTWYAVPAYSILSFEY